MKELIKLVDYACGETFGCKAHCPKRSQSKPAASRVLKAYIVRELYIKSILSLQTVSTIILAQRYGQSVEGNVGSKPLGYLPVRLTVDISKLWLVSKTW